MFCEEQSEAYIISIQKHDRHHNIKALYLIIFYLIQCDENCTLVNIVPAKIVFLNCTGDLL